MSYIKTKKNTDGRITGAIMIIAGIVFLVIGILDFIKFSSKPVDLNNTSWNNLKKGQHVEITVDKSFDFYCTNTKVRKTNGVKTGESADGGEIMIPGLALQGDVEGYAPVVNYMGVKVTESQMDAVNRMIDNTFEVSGADNLGGPLVVYVQKDYSDPNKFYIEGTLSKMNKKEKDYAITLLLNYGYTYEQAESMLVPYVVKAGSIRTAYAFFAVSAIMIIIGTIYFVVSVKKKKEKELFANSKTIVRDSVGDVGEVINTSYPSNNGMNQPDTLYTGSKTPTSDTLYSGDISGSDPYGSYNSQASSSSSQSSNNDLFGNYGSDSSTSKGTTLNGSSDLSDWK